MRELMFLLKTFMTDPSIKMADRNVILNPEEMDIVKQIAVSAGTVLFNDNNGINYEIGLTIEQQIPGIEFEMQTMKTRTNCSHIVTNKGTIAFINNRN